MKRKRSQYQKNWVAATRALKASHSRVSTTYDSDESDSTSVYDTFPGVYPESDVGQNNAINQLQPETSNEIAQQENLVFQCDNGVDLNAVGDSGDSVNESSDDDCSLDSVLSDRLANWASNFQVKQNAVDSLLKILKQSGHPNLCSSARGLLKTARDVPVQLKSGMQYIYFPIAEALVKHWNRYPNSDIDSAECIKISLNIDGLPLFKSSSASLWPVLCSIVNFHHIAVFPVVLTYGSSKPKDLEFLEDLIRDLCEILENGVQCGNRNVKVSMRCIVCDAPARAFVKGTKLYSGYFGCDKCCQRGMWGGRMLFPLVDNVILRTELSFRQQSNQEHHKGTSPFCSIPNVDMVKQFPIDYMHQVCLGVMKKLLLLWIRGKREVRMSALNVNMISERLVHLKPYIPASFSRKPRSLSEIDRYKATEFRQFLLYTGKVVLDGILRRDLYDHFLSLNVAISILVSPRLAKEHTSFAHQLLEYFVKQGSVLYGDEFVVYNVHTLIHLAGEVVEHGSLDSCSAFAFENYMQKLKRFVRSGTNPIVQIAKRLSELPCGKFPSTDEAKRIDVKIPNNCFILSDASCCEVVECSSEIDEDGGKIYLCRIYSNTIPLFESPCDSRIIGVHHANQRNTTMKLLPFQLLETQAINIEYGPAKIIFMAMLHLV